MIAFDEILRIVSVPLHGAFEQPVPAGAAALVPVRLETAEATGEPCDHRRCALLTVVECNAFGTHPELQAAVTLLEGTFSVR